jgi:hypothetical protein
MDPKIRDVMVAESHYLRAVRSRSRNLRKAGYEGFEKK